MEFTEGEERLIEDSWEAYLTQSRQQALNCQVNNVNTDSESGNSDQWLSVNKLNSPEGIKMITEEAEVHSTFKNKT